MMSICCIDIDVQSIEKTKFGFPLFLYPTIDNSIIKTINISFHEFTTLACVKEYVIDNANDTLLNETCIIKNVLDLISNMNSTLIVYWDSFDSTYLKGKIRNFNSILNCNLEKFPEIIMRSVYPKYCINSLPVTCNNFGIKYNSNCMAIIDIMKYLNALTKKIKK